MDYDNVRNVLGYLTRGQEHIFTTPELRIEVKFTKEGEFSIFRTTRSGSSSIESYTSLKDAVNSVMRTYYPRAGQVYQHINSNIYTVVGELMNILYVLITHLQWFIKVRMDCYGLNH